MWELFIDILASLCSFVLSISIFIILPIALYRGIKKKNWKLLRIVLFTIISSAGIYTLLIFSILPSLINEPIKTQSSVDNLLPMYGGENRIKTSSQIEADEKFISEMIDIAGSREEAAEGIVNGAWEFFEQGDIDIAMKRFNQAWLLDPQNIEAYKGFAAILEKRGQPEEARKMLQKAQDVSTAK